jgi:hypothetical protein
MEFLQDLRKHVDDINFEKYYVAEREIGNEKYPYFSVKFVDGSELYFPNLTETNQDGKTTVEYKNSAQVQDSYLGVDHQRKISKDFSDIKILIKEVGLNKKNLFNFFNQN